MWKTLEFVSSRVLTLHYKDYASLMGILWIVNMLGLKKIYTYILVIILLKILYILIKKNYVYTISICRINPNRRFILWDL